MLCNEVNVFWMYQNWSRCKYLHTGYKQSCVIAMMKTDWVILMWKGQGKISEEIFCNSLWMVCRMQIWNTITLISDLVLSEGLRSSYWNLKCFPSIPIKYWYFVNRRIIYNIIYSYSHIDSFFSSGDNSNNRDSRLLQRPNSAH